MAGDKQIICSQLPSYFCSPDFKSVITLTFVEIFKLYSGFNQLISQVHPWIDYLYSCWFKLGLPLTNNNPLHWLEKDNRNVRRPPCPPPTIVPYIGISLPVSVKTAAGLLAGCRADFIELSFPVSLRFFALHLQISCTLYNEDNSYIFSF